MMTEEELELKYLRYFHAASDFGPADSDVRAMINADKEWFSEFHKKGIESAKQWHSSPEGNNCKAKDIRKTHKRERFLLVEKSK